MFRILQVDDDPSDVRLLREAMVEHSQAVEFRVAGDGMEALDVLRGTERSPAWRPDLVICDLHMPRMDGHEFLNAMQADPELRRIPVVILSSSTLPEDRARGDQPPARAFFRKPATLEELGVIARRIAEVWAGIGHDPQAEAA